MMRGGFVAWLKTRVSGNGSEDTTASTVRETSVTTALYACPDCETTYVSEEMASCPECGQPVESVPNERDLGLT